MINFLCRMLNPWLIALFGTQIINRESLLLFFLHLNGYTKQQLIVEATSIFLIYLFLRVPLHSYNETWSVYVCMNASFHLHIQDTSSKVDCQIFFQRRMVERITTITPCIFLFTKHTITCRCCACRHSQWRARYLFYYCIVFVGIVCVLDVAQITP